jgi:(2Fe-2S) ferredoxin
MQNLDTTAQTLGLSTARRHLFLCADQTEPKCCAKQSGIDSWNYLKRRVTELGLATGPTPHLLRTKANCLRACTQGPIAVVYPDGTWYHSCTPEIIERILQEHILQGIPVKEYTFAQNPNFGP